MVQLCQGNNCKAVNGSGHSDECIKEHDKTVSPGELDTPGNRNPDSRYRGYKGEPLGNGASKEQIAAWHEGRNAREPLALNGKPSAAKQAAEEISRRLVSLIEEATCMAEKAPEPDAYEKIFCHHLETIIRKHCG